MKKFSSILSKEYAKEYANTHIEANDSNIKDLVNDALEKYGPTANLNFIDVGKVTNMDHLFEYSGFCGDVSEWDVSSVVSMEGMFIGCNKFNSEIGDWTVSNVENMDRMFEHCKNFNQDLSKWNVSNVKTMNHMFFECHLFDKNLKDWDVRNVIDMNSMFAKCINFRGKGLRKWNMKNVQNIDFMFRFCLKFEEDISKWDLRSCTSAKYFYDGAPNLIPIKRPMIAI